MVHRGLHPRRAQAELRRLPARERLPQLRHENTVYNGYEVPTFAEVLALRSRLP
ncbi:hypothetical protein [Pedococcus sp. 5OH_020]|uniref:hypothetical protein n=1 Tax=Pedococcus sp. 5OH_020 TaxID=2989814 RepID=UPI002FDC5A07